MNVRSGERLSALAMTLYRGSAVFLAIYGFGSTISFGVHLLMARLPGANSYGYFESPVRAYSSGQRNSMIKFPTQLPDAVGSSRHWF